MAQKALTRRARSGKPLARLHFLGATRCVTGSLYIFEYSEDGQTVRFFVDMGLAQEDESLNFQNRLVSGMKAGDLAFGVFTHAHIDHVGLFPKLYKDGFRGEVYATPPTADLLQVLLPDSGHLQEEEAASKCRRKKRHAERKSARLQETAAKKAAEAKARKKTSRRAVAVPEPVKCNEPLYTEAIARESLSLIKPVDFGTVVRPHPAISIEFKRASHLLGAAVVVIEIGKGQYKRRVVFSGDLGRPGMPIIKDLERVSRADYLICEGTYGARLHPERDRLEALAAAINRAHQRALVPHKKFGCGVILIPAFAVGRVQSVLYDLRTLMADGRIASIPVYVDSPMANKATAIYRRHTGEYNAQAARAAESGDLFSPPAYTEVDSAEASKLLDQKADKPLIIVGSSGMASGGRIVHHLKQRLPGQNNTVIFIGFQAAGTLGRHLNEASVETVSIGGEEITVRAAVERLEDYSGHADYRDILQWLSGFSLKPKQVFLVHGDGESLESLALHIKGRMRTWDVQMPTYRQSVDLI